MNTHKVLARAGYSKRPDYTQVARETAMLVKHHSLSEQELLAVIASKFGAPPPRVEMRDKALEFAMYGDPGVDVDYGSVEQMRKVMRLPVTVDGALMPDAHLGYAMPIGGVAALDNAVSPSFVGYDIACSVTMTI